MSDPVVNARARAVGYVGDGLPNVSLGYMAEVGAREALKPMRQLHRPVESQGRRICHTYWDSMGDYMRWPCPSAQHLYTSEELA